MITEAILCLATKDRAGQPLFSNALSEAVSKPIPLAATRRETLAWLTLLIMRQGTICLWRLAAHGATRARRAYEESLHQ